jgi:multisubunit Na+/H+ antiporter MnhF subunit
LLLGALLGWVIALMIGKRLWLRPMALRRPDLMLRLAGRVLFDIVRPTWKWPCWCWARCAACNRVHPGAARPGARDGVDGVDQHRVAESGTLCAELSDDRRMLLIHVLHLQDEAALVGTIKSRYEAPLRRSSYACRSDTGCLAMQGLAFLLTLARLLRGPSLPDRIIALDTLSINAIALLVLYGMVIDSTLFFEIALLIAVTAFIGTVALTKYLQRGDIIELR